MPIRKKLPLVIILLITIPLITLSFIIYFQSTDFLYEKSIKHISQAVEIESDGLGAWVYAQKKEVELSAQIKPIIEFVKDSNKANTLASSDEIVRISELLKTRVDKVKEIDASFIINRNGVVLASSDKSAIGISVDDRQYYKESVSGNTYISDMQIAKNSGQMVVVASAPIRDESGVVIGILANTIKLTYIREFISNVKIGDTGYAYLIDSRCVTVAHPDSDRLGKITENETIIAAIARLYSGETIKQGKGFYKYQGKLKYMEYNAIPGTIWVLAVTQNVSDIVSSAIKLMLITLFATIVTLIIGILISIKFSKTITGPITQLTESMRKAAEGDLTTRCEFESKCEFGELSDNFNIMIERLYLSHEELAAVYEELSATEEELRAQYDELLHNEEALRNSDERYRLALDGANDVIWEWNIQTGEFFASDKWKEITGYKVTKRLNIDILLKSIIHPEDSERVFNGFRAHVDGVTSYYKSEFRIKERSGNYKWVSVRGKMLANSQGKVVKLAGSLTDISERKNAEEKIKFMAYHDSLTNLPNRAFFIEKLTEDLKRCNEFGCEGAVLFIDLDDFKKINDTLGHEFGDHLLKHISGALALVKRDNDMVCRFTGDEFLILQPNIKNHSEVIEVANAVLTIFRNPFILNDKEVYITATIGITLYPGDGEDANSILKNADTAMYKAKEAGKNKYEFYDQQMYNGLDRKTKIEMILRNSIKNKELNLYYQPQVEVESGRTVGFEVLLRLYNEELGYISPGEFIAIAEETGLIVYIGEWVLREACIQNKVWKQKKYDYDYIAVNISAVQLQQPDFLDMVKRVLSETGISPKELELEITESIVMKSLDSSVRILSELRRMGVRVALDDFGTGYSSLNYLRRMPIDTLKVDKSFIDGISSDATEEAIADGIIQMAHKMNLQVVAEGVEYLSQLQVLSRKKCNKVQGYLFSRPVPAEDIEETLRKGSFKINI